MAEININNFVRIKLNDTGRAILRRNHDELNKRCGVYLRYIPPAEDEDGWSEWPLWKVMQTFGPDLVMGFDVPFDMSIDIPPESMAKGD